MRARAPMRAESELAALAESAELVDHLSAPLGAALSCDPTNGKRLHFEFCTTKRQRGQRVRGLASSFIRCSLCVCWCWGNLLPLSLSPPNPLTPRPG